jgi:ATP-dependent DNA ligase
MPVRVLADLRRRLDPLARTTSPLSVWPPRPTRFGSPLVLSRVHWVEPKLVAEVTYLTWTADNLLGTRFISGSAKTSRRTRTDEKPKANKTGSCTRCVEAAGRRMQR